MYQKNRQQDRTVDESLERLPATYEGQILSRNLRNFQSENKVAFRCRPGLEDSLNAGA